MRKNIIILILLLFSVNGYANQDLQSIKAEADSAYVDENYDRAVELYLQLAQENAKDAHLCYNLGCAYYRLDSIAKSILWFERAALIEPDDDEIAYNLDMVRTKTIDRFIPLHEMFFARVYRSVVNTFSSYKWACLGISFFVIFLFALGLYLFTSRMVLRKTGFFSALLFVVLTIMANVFAYQQLKYAESSMKGVIMDTSVTVKSTPSESGNDLFVIHEGTCVEIQDDSMKEWAQVRLSDGKMGWIEKKTFERI